MEQAREKKTTFKNHLTKLYSFREANLKALNNPSAVDAALMRIARHVTLPLEALYLVGIPWTGDLI